MRDKHDYQDKAFGVATTPTTEVPRPRPVLPLEPLPSPPEQGEDEPDEELATVDDVDDEGEEADDDPGSRPTMEEAVRL